jgi:WD40 repeat protein
MSPDGSTVFVTGWSIGSGSYADYATVAYDTATGEQIWVSRYNGPGNGYDDADALVVSPDGVRVVITGRSRGAKHGNYATIAYDASNGNQLWVSRYTGDPGVGGNEAYAAATSPDGSRVFVTGGAERSKGYVDFTTVAYDTSTGSQVWVSHYNGLGNGYDQANAIAVSPDGSRVFVTGGSLGQAFTYDYATVAYSAT